MTDDVEFRFHQGTLTAEELRAEIDWVLSDLMAEQSCSDTILEGIRNHDIQFEVRQSAGFDPSAIIITLVLAFATGAASESGKLVVRKILQKVKERRGDDAIGNSADE